MNTFTAILLLVVIGYLFYRYRTRRRNPVRLRKLIDPETSFKVFWMNQGHCKKCNTLLAPRRGLDQSFEIDHIVPFSRGGPCTIDNLQPLCRSCNRKKHDN